MIGTWKKVLTIFRTCVAKTVDAGETGAGKHYQKMANNVLVKRLKKAGIRLVDDWVGEQLRKDIARQISEEIDRQILSDLFKTLGRTW